MKRLAILVLSLILIIPTTACSRRQVQGNNTIPAENSQVNQTQNVNQDQNVSQTQSTSQKSSVTTSKDKKTTIEQTEKANTEIINLSNEIEKTLDSLDDIDESELSF